MMTFPPANHTVPMSVTRSYPIAGNGFVVVTEWDNGAVDLELRDWETAPGPVEVLEQVAAAIGAYLAARSGAGLERIAGAAS